MAEIQVKRKRRKLLKLKLAEPEYKHGPLYVEKPHDRYMVWCPEGDMPKRVYGSDEDQVATSHAKILAEETGKTFYVMRAWRAYEPKPSNAEV